MSEENKAIARQFYGILESGNLSAADEVVATDYVNRNAIPGQTSGLEGFKEAVTMLQTAFPDLQITIEDQIAEGDKVATRYTIRGTHQGEFMGIAATGKPVTWTALVLQRVVSGKIQESWLQWDQLGLTQQLGVVPPPGGSRG
jgi:steroid delta-isomerase-like uncharacterized protein